MPFPDWLMQSLRPHRRHTLADLPATPAVELEGLVASLSPGELLALPYGGDGERTILLCGSFLLR